MKLVVAQKECHDVGASLVWAAKQTAMHIHSRSGRNRYGHLKTAAIEFRASFLSRTTERESLRTAGHCLAAVLIKRGATKSIFFAFGRADAPPASVNRVALCLRDWRVFRQLAVNTARALASVFAGLRVNAAEAMQLINSLTSHKATAGFTAARLRATVRLATTGQPYRIWFKKKAVSQQAARAATHWGTAATNTANGCAVNSGKRQNRWTRVRTHGAAQVSYNVSRVDICLLSSIENNFRNAAAATIVLAPLQKNFILSARLVGVLVWVPYPAAANTLVWVPYLAAANTLVTATLAAATSAAANTLAPDFPGCNQPAVPGGKRTVDYEHAVSVASCMEIVDVSPGYGTHVSLRVNSSAAVVSVTLTITAVS